MTRCKELFRGEGRLFVNLLQFVSFVVPQWMFSLQELRLFPLGRKFHQLLQFVTLILCSLCEAASDSNYWAIFAILAYNGLKQNVSPSCPGLLLLWSIRHLLLSKSGSKETASSEFSSLVWLRRWVRLAPDTSLSWPQRVMGLLCHWLAD